MVHREVGVQVEPTLVVKSDGEIEEKVLVVKMGRTYQSSVDNSVEGKFADRMGEEAYRWLTRVWR